MQTSAQNPVNPVKIQSKSLTHLDSRDINRPNMLTVSLILKSPRARRSQLSTSREGWFFALTCN